MIRKLLSEDIDRVADIWLKTNLKAHYFISNQYWKSNYELVKEMLSPGSRGFPKFGSNPARYVGSRFSASRPNSTGLSCRHQGCQDLCGYISHHGTLSMDELMMEDTDRQFQAEPDFQMGGMQ